MGLIPKRSVRQAEITNRATQDVLLFALQRSTCFQMHMFRFRSQNARYSVRNRTLASSFINPGPQEKNPVILSVCRYCPTSWGHHIQLNLEWRIALTDSGRNSHEYVRTHLFETHTPRANHPMITRTAFRTQSWLSYIMARDD